MTQVEAVRSWYRGWLLVVLALLVATSIGTLVTHLQAEPLMTGRTVPVEGVVVHETKGFLGVRNLLEVEYRLDGQTWTATIPVKGDGFAGSRLPPYFYAPGDRVQLLVNPDEPPAARTVTRWVPAVHNWGAVAATVAGVLSLLLLLRAVTLRTLARSTSVGSRDGA